MAERRFKQGQRVCFADGDMPGEWTVHAYRTIHSVVLRNDAGALTAAGEGELLEVGEAPAASSDGEAPTIEIPLSDDEATRIVDMMIHHVPSLEEVRPSLETDVMNGRWHHAALTIVRYGKLPPWVRDKGVTP